MREGLPLNAAARAFLLALGPLLLGARAIAASCDVSTVSVAFGNYSPLSGASRESTGSVRVSCNEALSGVVSYAITLGRGTGSYASRSMLSGGHALGYNLFQDSARTLVWGDGTGGSTVVGDSYTMTSSPTTRTYPVYGRIPGGQTHAQVGTYVDTIMVTVTF